MQFTLGWTLSALLAYAVAQQTEWQQCTYFPSIFLNSILDNILSQAEALAGREALLASPGELAITSWSPFTDGVLCRSTVCTELNDCTYRSIQYPGLASTNACQTTPNASLAPPLLPPPRDFHGVISFSSETYFSGEPQPQLLVQLVCIVRAAYGRRLICIISGDSYTQTGFEVNETLPAPGNPLGNPPFPVSLAPSVSPPPESHSFAGLHGRRRDKLDR